MNKSEEFVSNLCERTFLSLWSYPSPRKNLDPKDKNKELCDILIVCDPDIVIFSVKEVLLKETGKTQINWDRWIRKAIDSSVRQIYGAERYINQNIMKTVITCEGNEGLLIPPSSVRKIHRVAVALGSEGKTPRPYGDFGKGFVHVLDEKSTDIVLRELDTITDFLRFLADIEIFVTKTHKVITEGIEDLLAMYLQNDLKFPESHNERDLVIVGSDWWQGFTQKPKYKAKIEADKISYRWDGIIEWLHLHIKDAESTLRVMAREDRFSRRILSKGFMEFLQSGKQFGILKSETSNVTYVFLAFPFGTNSNIRLTKLENHCAVARGFFPNNPRVIGLGIQTNEKGHYFDLVEFYKEGWTHENQMAYEKLFKMNPTNLTLISDEEVEYPNK